MEKKTVLYAVGQSVSINYKEPIILLILQQ